MSESRFSSWSHRLSYAAFALLALFLVENFCILAGWYDPVQIVIVGGYNSAQWLRECTADTMARFHSHVPSGPAPDKRIVAAENNFGFSLLRRLTTDTPGRNIFFSPYSVSAATTTCANGASGTTRMAILKALRLSPSDLVAANATQKSLLDYLENADPRIQARAANSVWADSRVSMSPGFVSAMQHNLNADVESADLHSVVSMARLTAWVIRNANGRLASAIPPLGADEHIALVNTITFHGKWKDQFKRANTHTGEFYLEDGTTKMLPMMSRSGAVQIAGGEVESPDQARWQYTVACLRYGDGSMSMLVVLPRFNHRAHLSELLPLVSAAQVDQWISHLEWSDRGLTMPRFQVNCRPELDSALKAIGLSRAYDSSHADFTAMGKGRDGRPIYLSHTIQNAYLEVDEEGTRAGAMTMHRLGLAGEHASIMVDRPFICLIRDNRTGMIVFAGAIYDPQAL